MSLTIYLESQFNSYIRAIIMRAYIFLRGSLLFVFFILLTMGNMVKAQEWIHSGPFGCNAKSIAVSSVTSELKPVAVGASLAALTVIITSAVVSRLPSET